MNQLSLSDIKQIVLSEGISSLGDELFITKESYWTNYELFKYPCRVNGYLAAYCKEGRLKVTIDLTEYDVVPGMLLLTTPSNIFTVESVVGESEKYNFIIIGASSDFISSLNINIDKLYIDVATILNTHCLHLSNNEKNISIEYLDLVNHVVNSDSPFKMESVLSLVSSVFYTYGGFIEQHIKSDTPHSMPNASPRTIALCEQFVKLVSIHHSQERMLQFYANQLHVTAKHLSKIVKRVSGISASQVIDKYITLEAKNLLKYSDLTIKEIAYELNFSDQALFSKFFRKQTGITPNQYREQ